MGEVELGGFETNLYRYIDETGKVQIHARNRLRTGDLGVMDEEGYVRITGRAKDLIIRGGVNISPAEIDNILLQMPALAEAATIGVPDAIYGEEVVCYVAAKDGVDHGGRRNGALHRQAARVPHAKTGDRPRPSAQNRTRQDAPASIAGRMEGRVRG